MTLLSNIITFLMLAGLAALIAWGGKKVRFKLIKGICYFIAGFFAIAAIAGPFIPREEQTSVQTTQTTKETKEPEKKAKADKKETKEPEKKAELVKNVGRDTLKKSVSAVTIAKVNIENDLKLLGEEHASVSEYQPYLDDMQRNLNNLTDLSLTSVSAVLPENLKNPADDAMIDTQLNQTIIDIMTATNTFISLMQKEQQGTLLDSDLDTLNEQMTILKNQDNNLKTLEGFIDNDELWA